jgi:glycosyltransferase involved in cell wall biosynthesis
MHKHDLLSDLNYSTMRLPSSVKPVIEKKPRDKFTTLLTLSESEGRKGEGGLRTRDLFKHSYKNIDERCHICDSEDQPIPADSDTAQRIKENVDRLGGSSEMKEIPLISIITVVFNGEQHLEESIVSLLNQTYPNVEYIIIDGGSTDGTLNIIKKYGDYIDYWISEPDTGLYDAMNKGIILSTGHLVGILNSDDWYEENALEVVFRYFNLYNDGDVYYGNNGIYSEKKELLFYRNSEDVIKMDQNKAFCHQNAFIRIEAYKTFGLHDIKYKIAADYDLIYKFLINNCRFYKINQYLVNYRLGGASSKSAFQGRKEELDIKIKYGVSSFKAYFSFAKAILRLMIRRILKLEEDSIIIKLYLRLFSPSIKPVEHETKCK